MQPGKQEIDSPCCEHLRGPRARGEGKGGSTCCTKVIPESLPMQSGTHEGLDNGVHELRDHGLDVAVPHRGRALQHRLVGRLAHLPPSSMRSARRGTTTCRLTASWRGPMAGSRPSTRTEPSCTFQLFLLFTPSEMAVKRGTGRRKERGQGTGPARRSQPPPATRAPTTGQQGTTDTPLSSWNRPTGLLAGSKRWVEALYVPGSAEL